MKINNEAIIPLVNGDYVVIYDREEETSELGILIKKRINNEGYKWYIVYQESGFDTFGSEDCDFSPFTGMTKDKNFIIKGIISATSFNLAEKKSTEQDFKWINPIAEKYICPDITNGMRGVVNEDSTEKDYIFICVNDKVILNDGRLFSKDFLYSKRKNQFNSFMIKMVCYCASFEETIKTFLDTTMENNENIEVIYRNPQI